MSEQRKQCLISLQTMSNCNVVFLDKDTIMPYILSEHPLHPAYMYLSETHKADYLRTYFMNFYGGGYSDIKYTTQSWIPSFDALDQSDKWICGYKEIGPLGVATGPDNRELASYWKDLIGNGAYICKSQSPLTKEWYSDMIKLLDSNLELLKLHPASHPQDSAEKRTGYPIEWNEMLGRIFHRISYKYKEYILNSLPAPRFSQYR